MSEQKKQSFPTYKGKPLVRSGDTLYYGSMRDKYVIKMNIKSKKKVGDLEVADKVTIQGTPESSVSVYKGQVTLKGGFPDGMLIRINGREASKEDVKRLESGKIRRMEVYKGDEAVKRYGEKGRNGVVEIRARR